MGVADEKRGQTAFTKSLCLCGAMRSPPQSLSPDSGAEVPGDAMPGAWSTPPPESVRDPPRVNRARQRRLDSPRCPHAAIPQSRAELLPRWIPTHTRR
jgi:hypothetical protein